MGTRNQKSKKKLKTKVKIKIDPPYICKICGKELKSIPGLASHLKTNMIECPMLII
jgi:transcription elongation factor Elf1